MGSELCYISERFCQSWLIPAGYYLRLGDSVSSEKRSKICANTRCSVFGFCPNVFRQCQQDFTHAFLCNYSAQYHSYFRFLWPFCYWCFVLRQQGLCSPGSPWTGQVDEHGPPCQAKISVMKMSVSFSHAQVIILSDSFLWDKSHSGAGERNVLTLGTKLRFRSPEWNQMFWMTILVWLFIKTCSSGGRRHHRRNLLCCV